MFVIRSRERPPLLVWLLRFSINVLALLAADRLVGGLSFGDWRALAGTAMALGLVNSFAKPLLSLLTCPLILLTLGLFLLVINMAMLSLAVWLARAFGADARLGGFGPTLAATLIITVVSWLLSALVDGERIN